MVSRPSTGVGHVCADVHQHERAGAVGVLGHARLEARLAEQRGLLVAGDAADRDAAGPAAQPATVDAEPAARRPHLGQHATRHAEQVAQLGRTTRSARMSKSIVRLGVRRRRWRAPLAAGQLPQEPRVDRAEREVGVGLDAAFARAATRASSPRSTGRARDRSRRGRSGRWPASRSSSQRAAVRRSCHTMARCSGAPVRRSHDHDRLALVGDADGGDRLGRAPRTARRAPSAIAVPDLVGVVLDPAGLREVLRELAVRPPDGRAALVDGEGPHARSSRHRWR